ncbi:hypothetical protein OBK01_06330 [Empedobacter falsenii]
MTDQERYFQSLDDLKENWDSIDKQKKVITIRNVNNPILFDYVDNVIVDNPNVEIIYDDKNNINIYNSAQVKLNGFMTDNHLLKGKFYTRKKCTNCFCKYNYLKETSVNNLERLFL